MKLKLPLPCWLNLRIIPSGWHQVFAFNHSSVYSILSVLCAVQRILFKLSFINCFSSLPTTQLFTALAPFTHSYTHIISFLSHYQPYTHTPMGQPLGEFWDLGSCLRTLRHTAEIRDQTTYLPVSGWPCLPPKSQPPNYHFYFHFEHHADPQWKNG